MSLVLLFLSALAVGYSGAMMPGPLLTYTIRQSLSTGPKAGFIVTAGHAILELGLVVLIFLGFDIVLKSDIAQIGIGLVGGVLLLVMGLGMIVGAVRNTVHIEMAGQSGRSRNMVLSGIAVSAASPYFLLWWAVVGFGFILQSYRLFGTAGVILYYLGHISADFTWYGLISVIAGTTRHLIKEKLYRVIIGTLGALLIFFAASFIYQALSKAMTLI
jgi:threonine/homoserine/homoserine lactone efflux protein